MRTPQEIAGQCAAAGRGKAALPPGRQLLLGLMAGMFIALAGAGASTASCAVAHPGLSRLLGALIFPAGLAMIVLAGGELFTGNALMLLPLLRREIGWSALLRSWLLVYLGNFAGAFLIALLAHAAGLPGLFGGALAGYLVDTAAAKVSLPFSHALLRGVLCNLLVCVAVWMGYAARSAGGKLAAIYFPVLLFVLCCFEHCVANMYYIPAGLLALGEPAYAACAQADAAGLTWGRFLAANLLPVTLGNLLGGAGLVALPYFLAYGRAPEAPNTP